MAKTLADIAAQIGGELFGDPDREISGVGTLANAREHQISFLANTKYRKYLKNCRAGAVIVARGMSDSVYTNAIEVDDPYVGYARAAALLFPNSDTATGVHPRAWVDELATLGRDVSIGAHAVIEAGVQIAEGVRIGAGSVVETGVIIGKGSRIMANVTLSRGVRIGERVTIHPGVVIGADGFGIANDDGQWIKVPQLGSVVIGDDVEIGANTTIDRGAIEDTVIGRGVKIDNQIQIGHNVVIGEHTVIAGCVGISGSTRIGSHCAIGGGTGIAGHIEIADGVQLTGMSMVTKSLIEPGVYSSGIPAEPTRQWHRNIIRYRQMDALFERVKLLEGKSDVDQD